MMVNHGGLFLKQRQKARSRTGLSDRSVIPVQLFRNFAAHTFDIKVHASEAIIAIV